MNSVIEPSRKSRRTPRHIEEFRADAAPGSNSISTTALLRLTDSSQVPSHESTSRPDLGENGWAPCVGESGDAGGSQGASGANPSREIVGEPFVLSLRCVVGSRPRQRNLAASRCRGCGEAHEPEATRQTCGCLPQGGTLPAAGAPTVRASPSESTRGIRKQRIEARWVRPLICSHRRSSPRRR